MPPSPEPAHHQVPDRLREGFLGAVRDRCLASVGSQHHGLVLLGAEGLALPHLVHHQQIAPLAGQFGAAVGEDVVGLGGEADDHLSGAWTVRRDLREDVRITHQDDGLGLLAALRCASWSTPVVLMTAFGTKETHEEAGRLGATVLDKPFPMSRLGTIARWLVQE